MQTQLLIAHISGFLDRLRECIACCSPLPFAKVEAVFDFQILQYRITKEEPIILSLKSLNLVARLIQLILQIRNLLQQGKIATKRSLYYKYIKHYKDHYLQLDLDLKVIARTLKLKRSQLNVVASSKCLLNGHADILQGEKLLRISRSSSFYLTNTDTFKIQELYSKIVVIVEKESVFNHLASRTHNHSYLLVTSKGYPDYITQEFLQEVTKFTTRVYYIGDIDPFGFDIMLHYVAGDCFEGFGLSGIEWVNLEALVELDLIDLDELVKEYMEFSKEDDTKINSILDKEFFGKVPLHEGSSGPSKIIRKFQRWKEKMVNFKKLGNKVEVEAFFKCLKSDCDILDILIPYDFVV